MGKMGGARAQFFERHRSHGVFRCRCGEARAGAWSRRRSTSRLTRDLVKLLQERTPDGYVFRVDLRLRPDPASTQIAISTDAALDYYESRGQNWERAALIKARAVRRRHAQPARGCCAISSPFIWRKYLDYATIADVHEMKRQIHAYRGHGEIAVEGHNIKLGRGGIREIEFFVQTQQLIAGGRHAELRGRGTVAMLDGARRRAAGSTPRRATSLTAAYDFLRRVEHRLQMMADEQTHTLPAEPAALDGVCPLSRFRRSRRICRSAACASAQGRAALCARCSSVRRNIWAGSRSLSFDGAETRRDARSTGADGLSPAAGDRSRGAEMARRRFTGRCAASRRARTSIELVPLIIDQFARAENPDAAFAAFDRFLAGLRAGGRFLSLLRQNPELMRFVALILGTAPRLADILAQNPQVIDPLVDPSFFGSLPDEARLGSALARVARRDARLRAGARCHPAVRPGTHVSDRRANSLRLGIGGTGRRTIQPPCRCLVARRAQPGARPISPPPTAASAGAKSAIVALGRLGAREMTANSDLDLIVIYDFDHEHPTSDGKRPLYGAQYFARFTQRLISALTVQTNYGVLYQVDMRLRPSGRSGPLATQFDGFVSYQDRDAWTWEHMALTRARVVSGPPEFSARIEAAIRDVLRRKRNPHSVAAGRRRDARRDRQGKGRSQSVGHQICRGRPRRYRVHRAIPATHAGRERRRNFSIPRRRGCWKRRPGLPSSSPKTPTSCGPRFAYSTIWRKSCGSACRRPSIRKRRAPESSDYWPAPRTCPTLPALAAHVEETQRQVRECFVRILGQAP